MERSLGERRMKKPIAIISLIAIILIGLITWFWLANFKRVSHEYDLPMKGEARYNPLYGLKLSLRAMGQTAESYARIDLKALKLKPNDTLVLYSPPVGLSKEQVKEILLWVENGGHLILSSPQTFISEEITLFSELGISPGDFDEDCLFFLANKEKEPERLCGDLFMPEDTESFDWLIGDDELGYRLGHMPWGKGNVTILSTLSFMSNAELKNNSSRQLAYQVLASSLNKGKFHLIYITDIAPFWLLILKHGWVLIVSLLMLLIAWLVYRSQRFGPLQASPNPDRRALLEHIRATGEYMFHRQLGHELHLAALNMFNARLRRRDPMTAALTGDAQIVALAERTKIDPQKIRQALKPGSLRHKETFFHSVATLIQLRNQL
jgi:hypothetical protein